MGTSAVFYALNEELKTRRVKREFFICEGAALIALNILKRATQDVDVLKPVIDPTLKAAAEAVATTIKLKEGWINNGPELLANESPTGLEDRCIEVFQGSCLRVCSIGKKI